MGKPLTLDMHIPFYIGRSQEIWRTLRNSCPTIRAITPSFIRLIHNPDELYKFTSRPSQGLSPTYYDRNSLYVGRRGLRIEIRVINSRRFKSCGSLEMFIESRLFRHHQAGTSDLSNLLVISAGWNGPAEEKASIAMVLISCIVEIVMHHDFHTTHKFEFDQRQHMRHIHSHLVAKTTASPGPIEMSVFSKRSNL